ncbi:hypothetical protein ACS5PK_02555 [Roseateles sp. DB2]|uniref:hypothetical protein n=1 Tax=Roseateles sp. DB2 TaxID=3453717 RepID=UPI003EED345D
MTKQLGVKYAAYCREIRCDRCGDIASDRDDNFDHFLTLDFDAGYDSPFGDGTHVDLDLCHGCLMHVLGSWLRFSPSEWAGGPKRVEIVRGRLASGTGKWVDILVADHSVSEDAANAALRDNLISPGIKES